MSWERTPLSKLPCQKCECLILEAQRAGKWAYSKQFKWHHHAETRVPTSDLHSSCGWRCLLIRSWYATQRFWMVVGGVHKSVVGSRPANLDKSSVPCHASQPCGRMECVVRMSGFSAGAQRTSSLEVMFGLWIFIRISVHQGVHRVANWFVVYCTRKCYDLRTVSTCDCLMVIDRLT